MCGSAGRSSGGRAASPSAWYARAGSGCSTGCSSGGEALGGDRARRAVHLRIRHGREPVRDLGIEVGVAQEAAPVEEAAPEIADRPLHFALGPRPVRPADPETKAVVPGKALALAIGEQAAAGEAVIARQHAQPISVE